MALDVHRKFFARSERVKCVDFHPSEPWFVCSLFTGEVLVYDYEAEVVRTRCKVSELPVRTVKFIPRKNLIICGCDDFNIYVAHYQDQTLKFIKKFLAHEDYIRCLAVHPTRSFVLSSADDMIIKLWDWEKDWKCRNVFEGHSHYVMAVAFGHREFSFVSASLDRSVKVWDLTSGRLSYSLEGKHGHQKGVNCVAFYPGGDKPYLITGSDDTAVKVWNYQTKACVATLHGHMGNLTAVACHPTLPILITAAEDGRIRLYNSNTFALIRQITPGLDRCWTIACKPGLNDVAFGFDQGSMLLRLGKELVENDTVLPYCSICLDELEPQSSVVLDCGHSQTCRSCLQTYLEELISNHTYPIKCPLRSCNEPISNPLIERKSTTKGVPCPKCNHFNDPVATGENPNFLTCIVCLVVYCKNHSLAHDQTESCEDYERMTKIEIKDTKQCPVCSALTEREEGCFIIHCASCQAKWCWKCGADVSSHFHRCPNCGLGYRSETATRPSIATTVICTLLCPMWILVELLWALLCFPCAALLFWIDPVGAVGFWCCIFEAAKDYFICFFEDKENSDDIEKITKELISPMNSEESEEESEGDIVLQDIVVGNVVEEAGLLKSN